MKMTKYTAYTVFWQIVLAIAIVGCGASGRVVLAICTTAIVGGLMVIAELIEKLKK